MKKFIILSFLGVIYLFAQQMDYNTQLKFRPSPTITGTPYNVIADGIGTSGTNQYSKINAATLALSATGGTLIFPASPTGKCYYVYGIIQLYSNETMQIEKGACIQQAAGPIGAVGGPIFRAGLLNASSNNIWIVGGGTLDGNKDNITGTGDEFNQLVDFQSCTNCGIRDINGKNAWTGGVSISCTSNTPGDNVQLINVNLTGSRRNNLENTCGTNTRMTLGSLTNAGGGSLSLGFDNEPFPLANAPGGNGITSGITLDSVLISGNADGCINYVGPYDTNPVVNLINVQCDSVTNKFGALIVQNNGGPGSSILNVIGGHYYSPGNAGLAIEGFGTQNIIGVSTKGAEALYIGPTISTPTSGSTTYIINTTMEGTTFDISNFGFTTMLNSTLKTGIINIYPHSLTIGTSLEPGICSPILGLNPFVQASNSNTKLLCTSHTVVADSAINPGFASYDGTNEAFFGVNNNSGNSVFGGSVTSIPACWGANNTNAANGGTQGGLCVTSDGINVYLPGIQTFANNAAAVAAGLHTNAPYRITGTDHLGIVH